MRNKIIIFFVLLSLSVCYSRNMQIPIHFENSPTTIELYDMRGRRILKREFSNYTSAPFSLSNNLANQIYIMRVINGRNVITRKFTPNHRLQFTFGTTRLNNFANNANRPIGITRSNKTTEPKIDSITNIVFINGIWNTPDGAERNLERIRFAYEDTLKHFPGKYRFTLGYNETVEGLAGGLVD